MNKYKRWFKHKFVTVQALRNPIHTLGANVYSNAKCGGNDRFKKRTQVRGSLNHGLS